MGWEAQSILQAGGRFALRMRRPDAPAVALRAAPAWVSRFRGAETQFDGFSDADPFGDSTAQFTFPAVTPHDDLDSLEFRGWLGYYADVDLFWVPTMPADPVHYPNEPLLIDPQTQKPTLQAPFLTSARAPRWLKLWEGFVVDMDWSQDEHTARLQVSCQGSNFQLDHYLAKPFYPAQPWPLELLIADAFDHRRRPNLRTGALRTVFPVGWKLKIPKYTPGTRDIYTPVGKPGSNWSGYTSRQTGAWDHALTGFIQDMLAVMITDSRSGVTQGNQWTIRHQHEAPGVPGRVPVLQVRDRFAGPDFAIWVGQPGVTLQLSGDATQSENVIYGDGTSVDGTVWRNAVISDRGDRTDYLPLAAAADVYPFQVAKKHAFVSEARTNFGAGFDQPSAVSAARQQLARDRNPGITGTIVLKTDPSASLPRWAVRAGMTVRLKGFAGTGERGLDLHIAATEKHPMDGSVTLTVDSRYRDLLTVEEAQARTRDPLTPVRLLQVNRTSLVVNDVQAPWDYTAGSGYIPKGSLHFDDHKPATVIFPYESWAKSHPPLHYPSWYVKVNANAPTTRGRWSAAAPILTSERDTIVRSEFSCHDILGNILKIPFHVAIYQLPVTVDAMPHDGGNYSAFRNDAFATVDPNTGQPFPPGSIEFGPDQSVLVLWGGQFGGVMDRAGFSPGREDAGNKPTGLLVDEGTWSYDNTKQQNYELYYKPGQRQPVSAITIYAMFYAEHSQPVYFQGRLFRQNPGAG